MPISVASRHSAGSDEGIFIISTYYQWSPATVRAVEEDEEFREEVKKMIDRILFLIGEK